MRTVHYLISGILIVISIIVISVLSNYLGIRTGIILTTMVIIIGAIVYFLLPKVPKRDYTHEGIKEANKKNKY
jgi:hypothetical protein